MKSENKKETIDVINYINNIIRDIRDTSSQEEYFTNQASWLESKKINNAIYKAVSVKLKDAIINDDKELSKAILETIKNNNKVRNNSYVIFADTLVELLQNNNEKGINYLLSLVSNDDERLSMFTDAFNKCERLGDQKILNKLVDLMLQQEVSTEEVAERLSLAGDNGRSGFKKILKNREENIPNIKKLKNPKAFPITQNSKDNEEENKLRRK